MPASRASSTGGRKDPLRIVLAGGNCYTATMSSRLGISLPENACVSSKTVQSIITSTSITARANASLITLVTPKWSTMSFRAWFGTKNLVHASASQNFAEQNLSNLGMLKPVNASAWFKSALILQSTSMRLSAVVLASLNPALQAKSS